MQFSWSNTLYMAYSRPYSNNTLIFNITDMGYKTVTFSGGTVSSSTDGSTYTNITSGANISNAKYIKFECNWIGSGSNLDYKTASATIQFN